MTLGQTIRGAREAKGMGLREAAVQLQITPSYLSDIETDRRVPADDVLERIAIFIGVPSVHLYAAAGRLDQATVQYLRSHPNAIRLLRLMARVDLREDVVQYMINAIDSPQPA